MSMYTDIFCWNIRGFNKLSHRSGFKKWLRRNKPLFGSLLETHVQQHKRSKFLNNLVPGWFFEDNYGFSELGKIWVMWHPSVSISIISKSLQMITCEVQYPNATSPMVVSFVYASNEEAGRQSMWEEIVCLSSNPSIFGQPWSVLGDFNQILNPMDHSRSDGFSVDRATRDFRDCLFSDSIEDLNYRGCSFTWWNKQNVLPIAKKTRLVALTGIPLNSLFIAGELLVVK